MFSRLFRLRFLALLLAGLSPWLVGFDPVDSTHRSLEITVGAGGGRYHQVEQGCTSVEYVYVGDTVPHPFGDGVSLDRRQGFSEGAVQVQQNLGLFSLGARGGALFVQDDGYLFDTTRFLNTSDWILPDYFQGGNFVSRTMYYLNPYVSFHGNRRSFSGHVNLGVWWGMVPSVPVERVLPSIGLGMQLDSAFLLDVSTMEGVPLVSDGGPNRAMLGASLHSGGGYPIFWLGLGYGNPYRGTLLFGKLTAPINEALRINLTAGYSTDTEFGLSGSLSYRF